MLNELFELRVSMESAGIETSSWHNNYKPCPKSTSFLLMIGPNGDVRDLEPIHDMERLAAMRKYEVGYGFSFPAFNIQPLFHAMSDEAKRTVQRLRKLFGENVEDRNKNEIVAQVELLQNYCTDLWTPKEVDRIRKCVESAGLKDRLGRAVSNVPEAYLSITELMERASNINVNDLRKRLLDMSVECALQSQYPEKWIDTVLVSSAKTARKVSLVLELADRSSFPYPSNHERIYAWINECLLEQLETGNDKAKATGIDAFGNPVSPDDTKGSYPGVNLPVLGKVILRAMSSESPCQKRYGRADSQSFPAGGNVRQAMKSSLEWLCEMNRKWKTWADASGACGFTKRDGKTVPVSGLLLAYPAFLAEDPPRLAGLFKRENKALDPDGVKYESIASRVVSALNTAVQERGLHEVRVFVLIKADTARTKVLVSRKYDAVALITATKQWRQGCENIPPIRLSIGTGKKANRILPITPFPTEVVECMNVAWLEDGTKTSQVHGLNIGEGIAMLVESGPAAERIVDRALSLAVRNCKSLLLAIGHADHRRDTAFRLGGRYAAHAHLLPSILGLLLYKQNIVKGVYMQSAPFLIGRLFALADLLHKEYCRHVRQEQIPPQLIGNALMPSAMLNPVKGLARLQERLMIYQAWGNTATGEGVGLAKWALKNIAGVAYELAYLDLPKRTKDSERAQMLLGYLARIDDKPDENKE